MNLCVLFLVFLWKFLGDEMADAAGVCFITNNCSTKAEAEDL
jgi:hypothetical protein